MHTKVTHFTGAQHKTTFVAQPVRAGSLIIALAAVFLAAVPLDTVSAFGVHEAENNLDLFPRRPGDPSPLFGTTVLVAPGLNVASGRYSCIGFSCQDNFDSFRMEVPAGLQITLTRLTVPRPQEPGSFIPGVPEQLFVFASDGVSFLEPSPVDPGWKTGNLIGLTAFPNTPLESSLVLGPGLYDVVAASCCDPAPVGGGSWEVSFTSAAIVPLPAAVWLFGAGLMGLSGFCKKKVRPA